MRWKSKQIGTCEWHRCFAWLPIKIVDTWVWLEFYEYKDDLDPGWGSTRLISK